MSEEGGEGPAGSAWGRLVYRRAMWREGWAGENCTALCWLSRDMMAVEERHIQGSVPGSKRHQSAGNSMETARRRAVTRLLRAVTGQLGEQAGKHMKGGCLCILSVPA